MKKILLALLLFAPSVWSAVATSKAGAKSDDWIGLNNNVTTYAGSWLTGPDSTTAGSFFGKSGGSFYYAHAIRFPNLSIAQGSTIDSAEYWVKNSTNGCGSAGSCNSAQIKIRIALYNADNGVQVVDTAGFRAAWAARATSTGSIDTCTVTATWSTLNGYYRVPFNKLDSVIQTAISRAGWASGNAITLMVTPTSDCVDSARGIRNYDSPTSGSFYDSLWVSYTAGGGGSPSATPNVVVRTATLRTTTLRAPEKMFYRKENWRW